MKRKPDSMLPYLLVAALVAVPVLTAFIHALRTGYGVVGAPVVVQQQAPAQVVANPGAVRR